MELTAAQVNFAEPVGGPTISRVTGLYVDQTGLVQVSRSENDTELSLQQAQVSKSVAQAWLRKLATFGSTPPGEMSQASYSISQIIGIRRGTYQRGVADEGFQAWWRQALAELDRAEPRSTPEGLYVRLNFPLPGQVELAKDPHRRRKVQEATLQRAPNLTTAFAHPLRWVRLDAPEERFHAHPKLDDPDRLRFLEFNGLTYWIEGRLVSRATHDRGGLTPTP